MSCDMRTRIGILPLPNPILTAAGCAGSGKEIAQFFDVSRLGAMTTKTIMLAPRSGRPTPRMAETPSGMLSSVGLQGPGVDAFLQRDLPWLLGQGARTIVSIAGGDAREFAELAGRLAGVPGVSALEVNLACPNSGDRGREFAGNPKGAGEVISAVRNGITHEIPVLAKLSPDVTDVVTIARACASAGADALTMINTLRGMAIDVDTMRPALAGVSGGLSGPAIRPVAVRCIWQVHAALPDVPIIGAGGVLTGRDALEFILAGASAVAVGTATFSDPYACLRILRELEELLEARGVDRIVDAVGLAHRARSKEYI